MNLLVSLMKSARAPRLAFMRRSQGYLDFGPELFAALDHTFGWAPSSLLQF